MNRNNSKNLFFFLSIVLMFAGIGYCEDVIPDVNDFFKDGDYKDIEIVQPKRGFIGSPSISSGLPRIRIPSSDEDFLTKYIRIAIVEKIKLKNGVRVVFQIDEIDPNGTLVPYYKYRKEHSFHEPLYYAYLDVKPSGCKMTGSTRVVHDSRKNEPTEELHGILNKSIRGGIRFPLMFTVPPALNLHGNYKNNSWMDSDRGIVYRDAVGLSAPHYMRISSLLIQKTDPSMKVKREEKRYYSENDKTLSEIPKENSIEVIVLEKETQLWGKSDAWLWQSLERTDKDGNVMMRCRRVNCLVK